MKGSWVGKVEGVQEGRADRNSGPPAEEVLAGSERSTLPPTLSSYLASASSFSLLLLLKVAAMTPCFRV